MPSLGGDSDVQAQCSECPPKCGLFERVSANWRTARMGGGRDRDRTWTPYHVNNDKMRTLMLYK
jgi:hypothetical protein